MTKAQFLEMHQALQEQYLSTLDNDTRHDMYATEREIAHEYLADFYSWLMAQSFSG